MAERIHAAFKDGESMLDRHTVALRVWPPDDHPNAWNYATKGGPHAWVRTLVAAIKRHGIHETYDTRRRQWMIRKPSITTEGD